MTKQLTSEEAVKIAFEYFYEGEVLPQNHNHKVYLEKDDVFGDGGPTWYVVLPVPESPDYSVHDIILFVSAKTGRVRKLNY